MKKAIDFTGEAFEYVEVALSLFDAYSGYIWKRVPVLRAGFAPCVTGSDAGASSPAWAASTTAPIVF